VKRAIAVSVLGAAGLVAVGLYAARELSRSVDSLFETERRR
jgi:hypothetical protein